MKLILGTENPGKIKEISEILRPLGFEIEKSKPLEVEETGRTFLENAVIKAKAYSKANPGVLVLADDSGLVVPALNNLPGVYSARFYSLDIEYINKEFVVIGVPKEDHSITKEEQDKLNRKRLIEMLGKHSSYMIDNTVEVYSAIAFYNTYLAIALNGEILKVFTGDCSGNIIREERGKNGFGYDSIFLYDKSKKTIAEMTDEEKNSISHRGKALQELYEWLRK